jgi:hypothetical protein
MHTGQLEDLPAERPRSTTEGLSEVRDLSTLGLVAAQEQPHFRALSETLGPASAQEPPHLRALSVTLGSAMVESTLSLVTALFSAAVVAEVPPSYQVARGA